MFSIKNLFVSACAVTVLTSAVGCSMCMAPISGDPSCIEDTHTSDKSINPDALAFTAPTIAPCKDVFTPSFRAGDKRITVKGSGKSLEEATADAVAMFIKEASCDYIVGVTRIVSMKTHPTWRFFATTNYTVTFSGIPIYLDKLEKSTKKDMSGVKEPEGPEKPGNGGLTVDEVKELFKVLISQMPKPQPQQPVGQIKLTDINVQIQAKGATPDNAGVVFPAAAVK